MVKTENIAHILYNSPGLTRKARKNYGFVPKVGTSYVYAKNHPSAGCRAGRRKTLVTLNLPRLFNQVEAVLVVSERRRVCVDHLYRDLRHGRDDNIEALFHVHRSTGISTVVAVAATTATQVRTIGGILGCDKAHLGQKSACFQILAELVEHVDIRLVLVVVVKITGAPQMQLRSKKRLRRHTREVEAQMIEDAV